MSHNSRESRVISSFCLFVFTPQSFLWFLSKIHCERFAGCRLWIRWDTVQNVMYFCFFQNGRLISNSFTYWTHRARAGWWLVVACDWMSSCLHCWWTKLPFTTVAQNTQNLSQDFHGKLREETLAYYLGIKLLTIKGPEVSLFVIKDFSVILLECFLGECF